MTLKEILERRQQLLNEINELEKEAIEKFPNDVPRCICCKAAFDRGWHSPCCGGC